MINNYLLKNSVRTDMSVNPGGRLVPLVMSYFVHQLRKQTLHLQLNREELYRFLGKGYYVMIFVC